MRERNAALDLLKFIFAWVIVLFHANKYLPDQWGYFINGRLATEFFFLVSGCLMAATSERYRRCEPGQGGVWKATAGSLLTFPVKRMRIRRWSVWASPVPSSSIRLTTAKKPSG